MWDKLKEQFNILKLEKKKLYLVTNSEKFISKDIFLDAIASALQGGVDVIQLREPNIPDNVLVELGYKIRTLCDEYGATFIVNNRADIAQIVEADGVHLGKNDISISNAREILGSNAIIGKTTHNSDDITKAINDGADYITVGPIYVNKNKQNESIEYAIIDWINDNIKIPVFYTGEITLNNIEKFKNLGIQKIALQDEIMYAKIPEETARKFIEKLNK